MKRKTFITEINAPKERVWKVLWGAKTYPEWTAPFEMGSHAETDWKEGSKVLFLDSNENGIVSKIMKKIPNEYMSIEHQGVISGGLEETKDEVVKEWAGAQENYTLSTVNGKTVLKVEQDIVEKYQDDFQKSWPKAIYKIKELSEKI